MDIKTLEYMEERAKQARLVVKKISDLTNTAEKIMNVERINLQDYHGNGLAHIHSNSYNNERDSKELMIGIKSSLLNLINKEIAKLEQELAEL